MKKLMGIVLGAVLIAFGVIYALNAFGVTDANLSIDGWWTLFIIVPCVKGVIYGKEKLMSLLGVISGVLLLLAARDIFDFEMVLELIVPAIIVLLGIKLICRATASEDEKKAEKPGTEEIAAFMKKEYDFDGVDLAVSKIGAVFGGATCNLANAKIEDGAHLDLLCVFGGADIIVPDYVDVKINAFCLFGGISDDRVIKNQRENAITLNINGFCMFGGAEIK